MPGGSLGARGGGVAVRVGLLGAVVHGSEETSVGSVLEDVARFHGDEDEPVEAGSGLAPSSSRVRKGREAHEMRVESQPIHPTIM